MDLQHTQGTIVFKDKSRADMSAIAKAVKNAGFSIRFLKAELDAGLVTVNGNCIQYRGDTYFLLKPVTERNTLMLQIIGKEYLPGKELKKYTLPEQAPCSGSQVYYADVL